MFIDNNGLMDLDSIILKNKSYQKIMFDEIVTHEEIREQAELVDRKLAEMKEKYTTEQFHEVQSLLAEVSVLFVVKGINEGGKPLGK